jgi:uracil-DNA glycosylase family 4
LPVFNPDCQLCPRLSEHLRQIRLRYPDYHAKPVPAFGVADPQLLIVGLAPGMHGANATGRPFTGDYAGILLYETLHRYGYSNKPAALHKSDGLQLRDCRITNAVKCLPPDNKPIGTEISACNDYLRTEITAIRHPLIILALGQVAHLAVLKALGLRPSRFPFAHGRMHRADDLRWLVDSYHCSRYNTQTRRLTTAMFHEVFDKIQSIKTGNEKQLNVG